jgi:hypothetical protein
VNRMTHARDLDRHQLRTEARAEFAENIQTDGLRQPFRVCLAFGLSSRRQLTQMIDSGCFTGALMYTIGHDFTGQ